MSIVIETQATADASGGLLVHVPDATLRPHSTVQLKLEITEEKQDRFSKRFATRDDYLAAIARVSGKCSDPTFVPPADQPLEDIEPL